MNTVQATPYHQSKTTEWVVLAVGAALLVIWPFALSQFRQADIYAVMGPFAIVVIVLLAGIGWKFRRPAKLRLVRNIAIGTGCGVVMTLGTYLLYALFARIFPSLAVHVADLYSASRTEALAPALSWTVVILVAEEVLWRGPLLPILERRVGRRVALAISLVTYVAAQSASGSPIVALAALVCGAIWLAERELTGSIVPSLVSHLIWTPIVIHLWPVTALR